jgi:hypothetical protein
MELLKNFFMRSPGGENEGGGNASDDANKENSTDENAAHAEEKPHEKGILGKIKDALRDWSEKDQQDQAFDDTRV